MGDRRGERWREEGPPSTCTCTHTVYMHTSVWCPCRLWARGCKTSVSWVGALCSEWCWREQQPALSQLSRQSSPRRTWKRPPPPQSEGEPELVLQSELLAWTRTGHWGTLWVLSDMTIFIGPINVDNPDEFPLWVLGCFMFFFSWRALSCAAFLLYIPLVLGGVYLLYLHSV